MIVIARQPGNLANNLFLFAHTIAVAVECEVSVMNPSFAPYSDPFPAIRRDPWCRFPPRPDRSRDVVAGQWRSRLVKGTAAIAARVGLPGVELLRLDWHEECDMEGDHFRSLLEKRFVLLQGWEFHADNWFVRHASAIREYFSLDGDLDRQIEGSLAPLRRRADIVVGLHIRQGDYSWFEDGAHFFETTEYASLARHLQATASEKRVAFLVCSNEEQDAGLFGDLDFGWGPGDPHGDLFALSRCDYIVGPKSTFSMWASFFGQVPLLHMQRGNLEPSFGDFSVYISTASS